MKNLRSFIRCCLFLSVSAFTAYKSAAQCQDTLWSHVYHSYRLYVNDSCMSADGTIWSLIYEADGDIHIRLSVDSPFLYMLNAANYSGEYGKLVCEPLCATTCTQTDAIASCAGFTNTVFIPAVGEHVIVTGSFVTDNDHGWNEIHPVSKITIGSLGTAGNLAPYNKPEVSVFPNPATTRINFKLSEPPSSPVYITISDELGRLAGQYQMLQVLNLEINTRYLPGGNYYYHISKDNAYLSSGSFILNK